MSQHRYGGTIEESDDEREVQEGGEQKSEGSGFNMWSVRDGCRAGNCLGGNQQRDRRVSIISTLAPGIPGSRRPTTDSIMGSLDVLTTEVNRIVSSPYAVSFKVRL